jgi:hypothetical protein
MRPVPLSPSPPPDDAGKLRWLVDKVTALCNASQVDKPADVASEMAGAYQPLDSDLTAIAALATTSYGRALLTYGTEGALKAALNLEANTDFYAPGGTDVAVVDGGTGASTASGARTNLELVPSNGLELSSPNVRMTANQRTTALIWVIDGGGAPIETGVKGYLACPFACTITAARSFADVSGSIVVDIWKDTYANYPPVDADSITASAPVTISAATKSEDATLTGWTTSISAGDILGFNVDSVSTITRLTIVLTVTKT